ncbi:MAG: lantibiotic dehydratase, partial [Stackebrandtia sp.]
ARIAAAAVSAAAIVRIIADADLPALEPYRLTGGNRATFDRLRPLARRLDQAGYLGSPDAWHARTAALHTWRDLLPANRTIDCASSAVHMHANRMIGDNRTERIIRALAKDLIARRRTP